MLTVTKTALGHFLERLLFAPALHHHAVHRRHQTGAVRTVLAVHEHRAVGFGGLNRAQSLEHIAVVDVVGAIRQLHLLDARRGEPVAISVRQEVDHRDDMQIVQQRHRTAAGQGAAIQRR